MMWSHVVPGHHMPNKDLNNFIHPMRTYVINTPVLPRRVDLRSLMTPVDNQNGMNTW